MRFFHGGPIWPQEAGISVWRGTGALVSFARPEQVGVAFTSSNGVILDNGAFSEWNKTKKNKTFAEWTPYFEWTEEFAAHPRLVFSIVPDGIEAGEHHNKELAIKTRERAIAAGNLHKWGVVWHLDESYGYLKWCMDNFSTVCLGSTSAYPPGSNRYYKFLDETFAKIICGNPSRQPISPSGKPVSIHGLRMLRRETVARYPFTSCDSSFVATHMNKSDYRWQKLVRVPNAKTRGLWLRDHIEDNQSPGHWYRDIEECLK